ncbi:hypothetical protein CEUSTIGMA_g9061.t1 [Chlamydomonas eustigma]|uniref:Phorbol-ester/DAG-type domain-containing protein n=1 Tax=Chlamydomonas eustigma TaxID=1157962 RepID=A0A250XEZ7_9CHLO|nr:hypothetical protein CEUSTIGMA_g9061.t1 [Chlamydomonas eustigma]|eukprot:GAX81633.1 hypothetical protein CEUSTIGMA_g9061.t1 [Chlamydomonas eustigma]
MLLPPFLEPLSFLLERYEPQTYSTHSGQSQCDHTSSGLESKDSTLTCSNIKELYTVCSHQDSTGYTRSLKHCKQFGRNEDDDENDDDDLEKLLRSALRKNKKDEDLANTDRDLRGSSRYPSALHSDEWYLERRVRCCVCQYNVSSSRLKEGRQCDGCRRWFHERCHKGGESVCGYWFHTSGCRELKLNLREQALSSVGKLSTQLLSSGTNRCSEEEVQQRQQPSSEGSTATLSILDIGEMRRAAHIEADAKRMMMIMQPLSTSSTNSCKLKQSAAGNDTPFQLQASNRNSRHSGRGATNMFEGKGPAGMLRTDGRSESCDGEVEQENKMVDKGVVWRAEAKTATLQLKLEDSLSGPRAQRDLAAVATIFSSLSHTSGNTAGRHLGSREQEALHSVVQEELMEADYAVLLRDGKSGKPLAAASMLLFGKDEKQGGHMRIQAMATTPEFRRRGLGRRLVVETSKIMKTAAVPRMVIMYTPTPNFEQGEAASRQREQERGFSRALGVSELSLAMLADFKAVFSEYHRDFTRDLIFLDVPL